MIKPVVILVSPKGPANLGGVARLMGNFGLHDLRIVNPRCELTDDECKKRSLGAFHLIESAKVFPSLEEAISDLQYVVGFSMQSQSISVPTGDLGGFLEDSSVVRANQKWGMLFGREDNGLETRELLLCNFVAWIPTESDFPSINLTSAVAIALSSWFCSDSQYEVNQKGYFQLPPKRDEEIFFSSVQNLLREISFMKTESDHIIDDLQNMYRRARLSDRDLRILFGILSDIGRHMKKQLVPRSDKT